MIACAIVSDPVSAGNPYVAPVADFTPVSITVPRYTQVKFIDTSTHNPTSWQWFINGSLFAIIQNPSYFFFSSGLFVIKLIAQNSYGQDFKEHSVTVS